MFITELKEHVIFDKERDGGRIVEGDEIVETGEYDDTVQHLIIDGQVSNVRMYYNFPFKVDSVK